MIQAKDLRIGNILLYNGKQVSVAGISSPQQIRLYDGEGMDEWVFIDQLHPVELTEELLMRFGFVKRHNENNTVYWFSIKIGFNEYIVSHLNGWNISIDVGDTYRYLNKVNFAHALQNIIYSLCGKELTLK